jgi:hypothetical protein
VIAFGPPRLVSAKLVPGTPCVRVAWEMGGTRLETTLVIELNGVTFRGREIRGGFRPPFVDIVERRPVLDLAVNQIDTVLTGPRPVPTWCGPIPEDA